MQALSLIVALSLVPARAIHEGFHVLGAAAWLESWTITLSKDAGHVDLDWQVDAPWYAPAVAYVMPLVGVTTALLVLAALAVAGRPPATAVGRASTVITCLWLVRAGLLGAGDVVSALVLARTRDWTPTGGGAS